MKYEVFTNSLKSNIKGMSKKVLVVPLLLSLAGFVKGQNNNPMVRECNFPPANGSYLVNDNNPAIILNNYNSEEILVVVEDIMGVDTYSKVIFKNQTAVLKAADPYNRIPSGVYTVVASSRNEIYNQKIVVD